MVETKTKVGLTDEEMMAVISRCEGTVKETRHEVNKAQLKKVWDEWNMSVKPLIKHSSGAEGYDKEWVDKFWQALLEEIK